ncbi:hypothetical protein Syun_007324 [Stephania yunnanensis]|uniref:non-specific serine/threonine protein kinase n=1 Tax=Stephania yunnanensis TaxID=152371 RepID=A0AAP0KZS2_9MAGN
MKHIFKKLHFGSSGSGGGSQEPSLSSQQSPAISPSTAAAAASANPVYSPAIPPSPSASIPITPAGDRSSDYFSSEEEYQVQLALAISASNSDCRDTRDDDQIHQAKILSLGSRGGGGSGGDGGAVSAAEFLSRRYWDYDVLDYNEKVVDGFYDIYGLSIDLVSQGKMPSLADIQTNLGDSQFEVVVVNRAVDPNLEELYQVAKCIALGCPATQIALLAQRLADVVTEHLGGPVRDDNVMIARWIEKRVELRTSLHTTILPIGSLNVGLSRHRALLFKVLADNVGIPCKLVKGSHYTGIDDDAVNLIKLDDGSEYLVDLMGEPGTLIPADVSNRNSSVQASNSLWLSPSKLDIPMEEHKADDGKVNLQDQSFSEKNSNSENMMTFSSGSSGSMPVSTGYDSRNSTPVVPSDQSSSVYSSGIETSLPYKVKLEDAGIGDGVKEKVNVVPNLQYSREDPRELFADLNPFQLRGSSKIFMQNKPVDNKVNDLSRWRENVASGPGRPPVPMMWKNRSTRNEVPRTKQYEYVDGLLPRNNQEVNPYSSSSLASPSSVSSGKVRPEVSDSMIVNATGFSFPITIAKDTGATFDGGNLMLESKTDHYNRVASDERASQTVRSNTVTQSPLENCQEEDRSGEEVSRNYKVDVIEENEKNDMDGKYRRKSVNDRFMGPNLLFRLTEDSSSRSDTGSSRLNPMLEDVGECEILWEDLVIGERIGLGSYGEVYHADWNGTEVAVKKFLDQDFYGDALDEFRREVRIMRRLRHPNVVLFLGAVTRPPNLSIITEFLPRGSLYRILHRPNCQIDEKRRIKMALDVARGMNCLHTSIPPVVHRDLKSPNLLVDKNWNVKVCDFGLSRLKHHTFLSSKSTAGTPEWMAPEVLRNEPSNEKCDIYSFGVILWELATLRMPWSGMNPMQVVGAVGFQNRRLDIPKEIDPVVARIIRECWQTDPNLRPSFAQLTSDLKHLQQLAVPSHLENPTSPMPEESLASAPP